ncbi:helix-turn-helix transcriptional regulator [Catenulispora sp. NF23]|uniref:Helix-turn-helix transcriptional regulator n=1 Tax=Catenulispora pinistramenti TaxID=2705254 RepID=A0ABS5L5H3_9ACTN|nr:helix-turn-helix transcriptional regulator [Catenulispora pinistramenti]MBS2540000.1 helix-turn-helix transcriptional regulator [Catenulispora pinistramenti]MBS2553595.1 helix-turn-helix transcriptional regulator [Catenulispora pinistramenti]
MSSTSAVSVLAQGLRELRDFAEGPDGEELAERTGLTGQQIEAALAGERLPTREVTLALVEAWEGDVEAWREYWAQISELAEQDEGGAAGDGAGPTEKAATPAPPEPSIIVPIPEVEPGGEADGPEAVEDEAESKGAGSPESPENAENAQAEAEAAAVRARSAARAQLEANAQAAKAQSEAKAAAEESARGGADAGDEDADSSARAGQASQAMSQTSEAEAAGVVGAEGARRTTLAEATSAGEDASEAGAEEQAKQSERAEGTGGAAETPADSESSGEADTAAAAEQARAGVRVPGQQPRPRVESTSNAPDKPGTGAQAAIRAEVPKTKTQAKKSLLARVGVPILLFAIGVGVGAFGDHALNSKQSSADTSASVPPVSHASSSTHTSASSAGTSSPSLASTPTTSVNPTATTPTGTSSTTSTVPAGSVLGSYVGIQLASGYSINFLTDPYHPAAGTSNGPDTMGFFAGSFVDGRFYADRVAVLDTTDTGSYTSCLNDTRYQHDVLLSQVAAGSSFCITTGTGHLVLVTVRRLPSSTDANPYAVVDVTVWQSS